MPTDYAHLEHIDNVSPDYRHIDKVVVPTDDLPLPTAHLKTYDVRRATATIDPTVREEARSFLTGEVESGRLNLDGELGFVVLHLCGESFHFLIVCTWRNDNEMWVTNYAKDTSTDDTFWRVPQGERMQVVCVWELAAVLHERAAWTRYLLSGRTRADMVAYIEDRYSGPA